MIEGDIYTLWQGIFSGRFYPSRFPQEPDLPTLPAGRYTIVSSDNEETVCGTDTVATDDVRVQVDIVAKTHGGMLTARDAVIAAAIAFDPPPARSGGFQTFDEDTKTHRAVLDYVFQQSS